MMARLGDVCDILNGFAFKSEQYVDRGIRIIRIANVQKGFIEDSTPVFYPFDSKDAKKYSLEEGDMLMSLTGNVGRVAKISKEFLPAALNQRVACLRIKDGVALDKAFLFNLLNSDYFEQQCIAASKGVAQKNMSTEWLKEYEIPMFPIEQQKAIASLLDKVSELIALRKEQLAKLDQLVKSRFIELFGDPVYNTKKLPTKRLAELGSLDRGRSQHRPRNAPELLGGPYPLIQTGEVANAGLYITGYSNTYSELGLKQSKMWKAGTLCITIAANIAQTSILTFDACFPDSVVGFIPGDSISAIYMHYWFGFFQKILEEQAPQVAQKNINLKILSDLSVVVPNQEQQKDFIAFVEQTDKSKLTIQQSLDKLELLKKSLMQQYFG
ncbi:MAG: restriction endonuclease subunit S [Oscillospiraceae bacterium]|nr:restriction endonuclease subunit S [Oscillospiraceae bacterium]